MTKDEFIDGYMERSRLPSELRTPDGFRLADHVQIALPCACGADNCQGWAMVSAEFADDHNELYAPRHAKTTGSNVVFEG